MPAHPALHHTECDDLEFGRSRPVAPEFPGPPGGATRTGACHRCPSVLRAEHDADMEELWVGGMLTVYVTLARMGMPGSRVLGHLASSPPPGFHWVGLGPGGSARACGGAAPPATVSPPSGRLHHTECDDYYVQTPGTPKVCHNVARGGAQRNPWFGAHNPKPQRGRDSRGLHPTRRSRPMPFRASQGGLGTRPGNSRCGGAPPGFRCAGAKRQWLSRPDGAPMTRRRIQGFRCAPPLATIRHTFGVRSPAFRPGMSQRAGRAEAVLTDPA